MVGDCGVGKSSMLLRLVEGQFSENRPSTKGIDFKKHTLTVDGKTITLQIWDTAGQERFRSITQGFYKAAAAVMVVYDVSDQESFNNVTNWLKDIDRYTSTEVVRVLVGNKVDLDKGTIVIKTATGKVLATKHQIPFVETSALDGTNIQSLFENVARGIMAGGMMHDSPPKIQLIVRPVGSNSKKENVNPGGDCSC